MKPGWIIVLCIFCFALGGFVGRYTAPSNKTEVVESVKTDTIVTIDTVTVEKPIPKYITQLDERVDTIINTIVENDTVLIPLSLPLVEKVYEDSTYTATISGVDINGYPRLENIKIYNKNLTISEIHTIIKKKRWGWQIGIQVGAGYGFSPGKVSPYVGIGVGYGFTL